MVLDDYFAALHPENLRRTGVKDIAQCTRVRPGCALPGTHGTHLWGRRR